MLVQLLDRRRGVELHQVEVVRLHARQALLDAAHDVLGVKTWGKRPFARRAAGCRPGPGEAAALRGEEVLGAPVRDVLADALLGDAVVDRRVDEVDAGVEHGVEDALGLLVGDVAAARRAAQLHRAVAEGGDIEAGAAERALR